VGNKVNKNTWISAAIRGPPKQISWITTETRRLEVRTGILSIKLFGKYNKLNEKQCGKFLTPSSCKKVPLTNIWASKCYGIVVGKILLQKILVISWIGQKYQGAPIFQGILGWVGIQIAGAWAFKFRLFFFLFLKTIKNPQIAENQA